MPKNIGCGLAGGKWTHYEGFLKAFDASLAFEMLNFMGSDAKEGLTALKEKRRPNFD